MEFEEQPIIYKCVEAIHQQPKCFIYNKNIAYGIWHMVKTWSRLQRSNAATQQRSNAATQQCGHGDME
jgi:hypothetical protein